MNKALVPFLLFLFLLADVDAEAQIDQTQHIRAKSFYLTWGYNRSNYDKTDIRFHGSDFDFTLTDVRAHDHPLAFDANTYLNPLRFTIPQFDFRVGYFLKDNLSISGGWDHMKYLVTKYQRVGIKGTISESFSEEYAGTYTGQAFDLEPSFLRLEHTNGMNYVRFNIERYTHLWSDIRKHYHLELSLGLGTGLAMPWTDAYVDGERYVNWLHVAGWGLSGQMALKFRYKHFFYVQYQHQNGYLNMTDIIFMNGSGARAEHSIWFTERTLSLGFEIPLFIGGNPNKSILELQE